ncbi:malate synthase A [Aquipuribacter sp. MA13-6]|uniref:malate synthase A n=1 Tax=unclassified Aquipuribacter TaxID=2635084 RepID=UPI003EEE4C77
MTVPDAPSPATPTLTVVGPDVERGEEVLTEEALAFVGELHARFAARRDELLEARRRRTARIVAGELPDFLPETAHVRDDPTWRVAEAPHALADRRVEITGPTEPKMAVNALNSGARVWLADLEDANTPHWRNVVVGQLVLHAAARGTLQHTADNGKEYRLRDDVRHATPVVRPRGWHLDERHLLVDGRTAVGALVDFGLHVFHNGAHLAASWHGPFYYLPKTESHLEARLWDDVFSYAEERLDLAHGTIRATVLIETLPAAFEMEEILYELREHASGLNAGRWDYLFSAIKVLREAGPDFTLPDRNAVTMTAPFLRAYTELLVSTCHRRGAFAIGGMSAFIPSRRDPEVNAVALDKVRADKTRESGDGFDGSWVAHPDLVPVCEEVFTAVLGERPNQLDRLRPDVHVTAADLLDLGSTPGQATAAGLRGNVDVALRYLSAWLGGSGAVAIHNLMEDAATAEISRSQVWQWVRNEVVLDDGATVTRELVRRVVDDVAGGLTDLPHVDRARELFEQVALAEEFVDFLTLPAYRLVD